VTTTELAKACADAQKRGQSLQLELPWAPEADGKVYLSTDRPCPAGEVACVNAWGHTVAWFEALDVLAWLHANSVIKMVIVEEGAQ